MTTVYGRPTQPSDVLDGIEASISVSTKSIADEVRDYVHFQGSTWNTLGEFARRYGDGLVGDEEVARQCLTLNRTGLLTFSRFGGTAVHLRTADLVIVEPGAEETGKFDFHLETDSRVVVLWFDGPGGFLLNAKRTLEWWRQFLPPGERSRAESHSN